MKHDTAQFPKATQFLDLATSIANETCHYLEKGGLDKEKLQRLIGRKTEVRQIALKNAQDILKLVSENIIAKKELIQRFYLEVFNHKVDLSKVIFLEKEGFIAYCYNTRKFNVDQILAAYKEKWDINIYKYQNPATTKINNQQERPKGPYAFAHRGGDEPDKKHLGKSFDDAMEAGFPFANAEEYYLMQGLHKFTTGQFMDRKGWTRFSSLWSDGSLVGGGWSEALSKLCLDHGARDYRHPANGPRELFLSKP